MYLEFDEALQLANEEQQLRLRKKNEKSRQSRLSQRDIESDSAPCASYYSTTLFDANNFEESFSSANDNWSNDPNNSLHDDSDEEILPVDYVDNTDERFDLDSITDSNSIFDFNSFTDDLDSTDKTKISFEHTELLHPYTDIPTDLFCYRLFQLFRSSELSKNDYHKFLNLIHSVLPMPNNLLSNINQLLRIIKIDDNFFKKRKICLLCQRDIPAELFHCVDCSMSDETNIAFVYESDIKRILSLLLTRFWTIISTYRDQIRTKNDTLGTNDIVFGQVYQRLLNQNSSENFITGLFHLDGIGLCKSNKLKMWLFSFAVIELPAQIRYRRYNMPIVSIWVSSKEPIASLWLKTSILKLEELKISGTVILFLKKTVLRISEKWRRCIMFNPRMPFTTYPQQN